MLQSRSIGLSLLNVQYDIDISLDEVIEKFSKIGKHKVIFRQLFFLFLFDGFVRKY